MKTIVAATDFSSSSFNACSYAAFLTGKLNCKLTLFNTFEAPVIHSNIGLYGYSYSSIKRTREARMDKFIHALQAKFPGIKINSFVSNSGFKQGLKEFISKHRVMATVMGLETKNKISKSIHGSHGINVAGKINAPVIIIPQIYKEHRLEKIILAVDNSEKPPKSSLFLFEKLLQSLAAKVDILHVRTPEEVFDLPFTTLKLNGENTPVYNIKAKDLSLGLRKFTAENKTDLVCIISKNHSILYNWFIENNTKKIAMSTKIPVMALHE